MSWSAEPRDFLSETGADFKVDNTAGKSQEGVLWGLHMRVASRDVLLSKVQVIYCPTNKRGSKSTKGRKVNDNADCPPVMGCLTTMRQKKRYARRRRHDEKVETRRSQDHDQKTGSHP
jgi:hypothetical protein